MKKELAMMLRGRAFLELGPSLGVGATKRTETAFQVGARWGGGGIGGQRTGDTGGRGLPRQQLVLGLDVHRFGHDLRRHRIVAVAVAADPAPETQESRRQG